MAREGESKVSNRPEVPEGSTEPRPETETETEGSAEAPRARTTVGAPSAPGAATSVRPTTLGAQGAPSSQKSATSQAR